MKVTLEVNKNVERRLQQDYKSYHFINVISIINILITIRTERLELNADTAKGTLETKYVYTIIYYD